MVSIVSRRRDEDGEAEWQLIPPISQPSQQTMEWEGLGNLQPRISVSLTSSAPNVAENGELR